MPVFVIFTVTAYDYSNTLHFMNAVHHELAHLSIT